MNTLRTVFDKYKCDKGTLRHCYDRVYEPILEPLKDKPIRIMEVGVLKGESIRTWLEYLPQANIITIDIFTRVPAEDVDVLKEDRVSWALCDSIVGPNDDFLELVGDGFDIIIDDGLHTHDSQRRTFENFFPFLKDDGVYFIEDVWAFDQMTLQQKQHQWIRKHPTWYSGNQYKQLLDAVNTYNPTFHDLREGYQPDTYIIEIRK